MRYVVGMDRTVAKEALGNFAGGETLTATQIEFVNLIIDRLAEQGVVEPAALYESPFTDVTPRGPEDPFDIANLDALLARFHSVRQSALPDDARSQGRILRLGV